MKSWVFKHNMKKFFRLKTNQNTNKDNEIQKNDKSIKLLHYRRVLYYEEWSKYKTNKENPKIDDIQIITVRSIIGLQTWSLAGGLTL